MLSNKAKLTIFLIFIIVLSSVLAVDGSGRRGPRNGGGNGYGSTSGPMIYCCTYGYNGTPNCSYTTTDGCIASDGAFTCLDVVNATSTTTTTIIGTNTTTTTILFTPTQNLIPYNININDPINDPFIGKLINDAFKSGIGNRTYYNGTHYINITFPKGLKAPGTLYICDNFADDLQQYLYRIHDSDGTPYNLTFTVVNTYTWQRRLELLQTKGVGHCYVDVHKNGKVLFIEAQWTEAGDKRIFANLDSNKDGKVSAHVDQDMKNNRTEITEYYIQINIYKSKAEAILHGQPFYSPARTTSTSSTTSTSTSSTSTSSI